MDILGALNKNGSGLNITELSESLANAEVMPRKSLVQSRIDTSELRLSGYDRLRAQLDTVDDALTMMRAVSPRSLRSDSPALSVATIGTSANAISGASITIDQLATAQVLSFRGFTSPTQPVGGGALTIETGTWSSDVPAVFTAGGTAARTLTFAPDSSLTQIATDLDALDGISARVVDLGDGTFALGIISETGRENALRFSAPQGSGMAAFDFSADPGQVQVQQAQNAELRLNGIAVTRPSNQVDDLLPGVGLTLRTPTTQPANVTVSADIDGTLTVMQGFVDIINVTRKLVNELTGRNAATGSDTIALPGDKLALDAVKDIATLLSRGFGANQVHLAQIGILTERDGTLSLDDAVFTRALSDNPAIMEPFLRDGIKADTIRIDGLPRNGAPAGKYTFQRDPQTGAATVDGLEVFGNPRDDGDWQYRIVSGPLRGVTLIVPNDSDRAIIDFAPSMINTLQSYLDTSTRAGSALTERETALRQGIVTENIALERLSARQEELRSRNMARFTQMEQVVSQLNATADYLTNLVDGWNAKR